LTKKADGGIINIINVWVIERNFYILMLPSGTGTFHPTHWFISYIFAILSNVLIEGFTIKIILKHSLKNMFRWLFVANAISVIVCVLFHGIEMQNINILFFILT
jgi:hypothetical protein